MTTTVVHAGVRCPRCGGSMIPDRVLDSDKLELLCVSCGCTEVPVDLTALGELAEELEGTLHKLSINRRPYRGKVLL